VEPGWRRPDRGVPKALETNQGDSNARRQDGSNALIA
jgi:hypothetical protein